MTLINRGAPNTRTTNTAPAPARAGEGPRVLGAAPAEIIVVAMESKDPNKPTLHLGLRFADNFYAFQDGDRIANGFKRFTKSETAAILKSLQSQAAVGGVAPGSDVQGDGAPADGKSPDATLPPTDKVEIL